MSQRLSVLDRNAPRGQLCSETGNSRLGLQATELGYELDRLEWVRLQSLCVGYIPHSSDRESDRSNLREEGFILAPSLRVQSVHQGQESWWQEPEAGDHVGLLSGSEMLVLRSCPSSVGQDPLPQPWNNTIHIWGGGCLSTSINPF